MARPPREPGQDPEDRRLWARVARTVTPAKGRARPEAPPEPAATPARTAPPPRRPAVAPPGPAVKAAPAPPSRATPDVLEPRRQRRLARERDPIEATIDLHGFGRFQAEDELVAFLSRSQARGLRAVLVITGQGRRGGGVIRASAAEWLQGPRLRGVVSGFSSAHRRHGGDGAFYVTLRR
ncbi:Smr/MutS family protein [Brevundimonas balnearis]|uniref:Smr/MutS family protein n=1 Tax=Brevundimonas balnearis TaxID=1572858 RepID=A0ABV6R1Y5_9CAUL